MTKFAKEIDLCTTFIDNLPDGWTAYPETSGWDILVVHDSGVQIGVEAKLKLNAKVVMQTVESISGWYVDEPGPDFRAVLVPMEERGGSFAPICRRLGITVITCHHPDDYEDATRYTLPKSWFRPELPNQDHEYENDWFDCAPMRRNTLPDYVPKQVAGSASPVSLSHWKIGAIKLCVLMNKTGYLQRSDFKHFRISIQRWMPSQMRWLGLTDTRGIYTKGKYWPEDSWRATHPENFAEIEADFENWKEADRQCSGLPDLFK